jgi:uncharacterized protein (TIGR02594 family)
MNNHVCPLSITPFQLAERFVGVKEVPGSESNPQILSMLKLDADWPENDECPWCAGFVGYIMWLLRLPRSRSLLARSWLNIGRPIHGGQAQIGFDIVILSRGEGNQPGPENTTAPGHVGFYAGYQSRLDGDVVYLLGGNQNDEVNLRSYSCKRILGIRRVTRG